jgi:hypothetical protein
VGVGFQLSLSRVCRGNRVLLALGDDADEIADADNRNEPRHVAHGRFIDRDQAGADERAGIDASIGWAHHAAVQHAGHADVVHEGELAGRFRRQIDARHGVADDAVVAGRLDLDVIGKLEPDRLVADQLAIADAAIVMPANETVLDLEIGRRKLQPRGRAREQELPRLGRSLAQGNGGDLNRFARDRRALVWHGGGVAEHHDDAGKGHVEFLGDDLAERGANAGTEIDVPVIGVDRAVRRDPDERLGRSVVQRAGDDE